MKILSWAMNIFLLAKTTIVLVSEAYMYMYMYIKAAQSGTIFIALAERYDTLYIAPAEPLIRPHIVVYTVYQ